MKFYLPILFIFLFNFACESQQHQETEGLNTNEKKATIEAIQKLLIEQYIFPETAKQMVELMVNALSRGEYDAIADPKQFATRLTADLQSVSHDKHLRVNYIPGWIAERKRVKSQDERNALNEKRLSDMRQANFGFKTTKVLPGNIGYLDLRNFFDAEEARHIASKSMAEFKGVNGLIIDLRKNGGGSPQMIQFISSYFFSGDKPVHLNDIYWRGLNDTVSFFTLEKVPGERIPDTAIYLLTSNYTFSAAEEFCYNLKNLKRAILIGEKTGGGAHPGGMEIATDHFAVWIPNGRSINPISKTNWEGTGVIPHFEVPAKQAFHTAYRQAMEQTGKPIPSENFNPLTDPGED